MDIRCTYGIITILLACLVSCLEPIPKPESRSQPKLGPEGSGGDGQRRDRPQNYANAATLRSQFMAKPFQFFIAKSPPTVNTFPTRRYSNSFPKAAALGDYNQKPFDCFMVVNFGWPFEKNLPKEILKELEQRGLRNSDAVDIFWVIQPMSSLGGNRIGTDANITYLRAHGWADPDEPLEYHGTRLKRNFLYGIYDADVDISYEIKRGILKPFEIHVHDQMYSPQTGAVRFRSALPDSQAFWSLVIDHENPNGKIRAVATLHWLISNIDKAKFLTESFEKKEITDSRGVKDNTNRAPRFANIGDYIAMLETTSFLKDTTLVKKLRALVD